MPGLVSVLKNRSLTLVLSTGSRWKARLADMRLIRLPVKQIILPPLTPEMPTPPRGPANYVSARRTDDFTANSGSSARISAQWSGPDIA